MNNCGGVGAMAERTLIESRAPEMSPAFQGGENSALPVEWAARDVPEEPSTG